MLELGKAGSAGTGKGALPVLRDGAVVATLRASNWREKASALVGGREWVFAEHGRELNARLAAEPEDTARLRAWQKSFSRRNTAAVSAATGAAVIGGSS